MVTLKRQHEKRQQTCYFCGSVDLAVATYSGICFWHRCKISLRLLLLLLKRRHIRRGIWRMVRWGL